MSTRAVPAHTAAGFPTGSLKAGVLTADRDVAAQRLRAIIESLKRMEGDVRPCRVDNQSALGIANSEA